MIPAACMMLSLIVATGLAASAASACPLCGPPSITLWEQVQQADAAVLVQWVSGEPSDTEAGFPGSTEYEIVDIMRDSSGALEKLGKIEMRRYLAAQPGDLFLLLGLQSTTL